MKTDIFEFNGIDGRTGEYLLGLTSSQLASLAAGEKLDVASATELRARRDDAGTSHYGAVEGVDVSDLAQAGWGVVFAAAAPEGAEGRRQAAIREALAPLLELRRAQATRTHEHYFKVYAGSSGFLPSDTKQSWLARNGAGPGPADPERVPYYLLLVGDPTALPYRLQSQLGVQRAVGRIHFDTIDAYANYARSVVAAETGGLVLPRRATFFGARNADDAATQSSAQHLVAPLADGIAANARFSDWEVNRIIGGAATRAALDGVLRGGDAPALLFTASHGMGFPKDDPLQLRHQGALLCQDWPGPQAWRGKPIPEEFYLAGDHLDANTNLLGTVAFLFACYGAGTPAMDEYSKRAFRAPTPIAPHAFVAGLPQAMLNRPKGGALAVIGHVERAWGHSFMWAGTGENGQAGRQIGAFESATRAMLSGVPVGAALEAFGERYAELSSELAVMIEMKDLDIPVDEHALGAMWTANNDARGYAIFGDPAVRVAAGPANQVTRRPSIPEVVSTPVSSTVPAAEPTTGSPDAPAAPSANVSADAAFGWFDGKEAPTSPPEPSALQRMVTGLAESLSRALEDATSLTVSTWIADDLANVRWEDRKMHGAELRAFTRISLDGDTDVCLPKKDGEVDREVWDIHVEMVRQAQQTRADLLKTLVEAAAGLVSLTR